MHEDQLIKKTKFWELIIMNIRIEKHTSNIQMVL